MPVIDALRFIKKIRENFEFRSLLNSANNPDEFQNKIKDQGFMFTLLDIENAFNQMVLKCRDEDEAEEIKEIRLWYLMTGGL